MYARNALEKERTMAAPRKYTDEQIAEVERLVAEGATVSEAADTVGVPRALIYRKRAAKDPTPGGNPRGRAKVNPPKPSATDEQLLEMCAKGAVLPAVPAALWLRCDFCAEHFTNTGPEAAAKLVELSQNQPALRSVLNWMHKHYEEGAWALLLASYFGVPIAHHLAPDFIYRWLMFPLGLPPRDGMAHFHVPVTPAPNGNASPPPTPFAMFDTDSILNMAAAMGIKIELPDDLANVVEGVATDDTTETPAPTASTETGPATEDDTAEPAEVIDGEAVAAGPDATAV